MTMSRASTDHHRAAPLAACFATLLALAGALGAQGSSSPTWFLTATEQTAAESMQGVFYRMIASTGDGVVPTRAVSASYTLLGGFPAAMEAGIVGRPWAAGVRPFHASLRGGEPHSLHGAELDLGPLTQITVGGLGANVTDRTRDRADFVMPRLFKPGPATVTVSNSGGTSHLPNAVGILPMMEVEGGPFVNLAPNRLVYRGHVADLVAFLIAGASNAPVQIPPYEWGLELDFGSLVFLYATVVTQADGVTTLDVPPVLLTAPIYLQTFSFSQHPGYSPGAFTNTVRL